MLRNLIKAAPSARLFSVTAKRPIKSPSELYTTLLRDHPETLRQRAVSSFPLETIMAEAANRHVLRSRGLFPLDSACHTKEETNKLVGGFIADHTEATKDYVDSVISRFTLVLQEALAKNTQKTFFDVYENAIKVFLESYETKSSINDKYLAPKLSPENVIRYCFQEAAERMFEEFRHTKAVENPITDVHNHYNLSVKCSAKPGF